VDWAGADKVDNAEDLIVTPLPRYQKGLFLTPRGLDKSAAECFFGQRDLRIGSMLLVEPPLSLISR
jgi:hypothetical protein